MSSYVKALTPMLLSVLVGSLTFIFAQSERGDVGKSPITVKRDVSVPLPGGEQVRGFPPGLAEQLNLTGQQAQQIAQLHEASQANGKIHFETVKNADEQLRTMINRGSFDESQARQIISVKSQAMAELEIIHLRTGAAINNLLSDEQKATLKEFNANRPKPPQGGDRPGMLPPAGDRSGMFPPPPPPL